MALKPIAPFRLGGAVGCTAASVCLTTVLFALVLQNLAIVSTLSTKTVAGLFVVLSFLQILCLVYLLCGRSESHWR